MSNLDRFLVSEGMYDAFPSTTVVVLEHTKLDHSPILCKESVVDYALTPFCFFHSWLQMGGFHQLMMETWGNDGIVGKNGMTFFKKKDSKFKKSDL